MKSTAVLHVVAWCLSFGCQLVAAEPSLVLNIWPGLAPGEPSGVEAETRMAGRPGEDPPTTRIGNVTTPTLSLYQPASSKANRTAVLICPGGGYNILAWDKEGTEVAEWLNTLGVTAIVLKYRVPRRPDQDQKSPPVCALQDAQRAIRVVRSRAKDWGIDENRIGLLGFSAGGHLTAWTATNSTNLSYAALDAADKLSGRPDFTVLVYPAYLVNSELTALSPLFKVDEQTPPAFIVHAYDDGVPVENSIEYFLALKRAKVTAELHVYESGGHGYGLRSGSKSVLTWPQRCEDWLRAGSWIQ